MRREWELEDLLDCWTLDEQELVGEETRNSDVHGLPDWQESLIR
jgi:hypothetical protein